MVKGLLANTFAVLDIVRHSYLLTIFCVVLVVCLVSAMEGAWETHANSNDDLIDSLQSLGIVKTDLVARAMKSVDRKNYVPEKLHEAAYWDQPLPIGQDQTISAPHMHAMCLELLSPFLTSSSKVLDVGAGSGYLCSCFAKLLELKAKEEGEAASKSCEPESQVRVLGIEVKKYLVDKAVSNIEKKDSTLFIQNDGNLLVREGDGWKGAPDLAPYAAIHVGAAAVEVPANLVKQLASPGRMVIPVGPDGGNQVLLQVDKDKDGKVTETVLSHVRYVPLVRKQDE